MGSGRQGVLLYMRTHNLRMTELQQHQEPKAKRAKTDAIDNVGESQEKLLPFSEFSVDRVLFMKPDNKSISLLGRFAGSDKNGVLVVEKQPITEDSIKGLLSRDAMVTSSFHNDIYSQYVVLGGRGLGEVRVMGVYPATEEHVAKYSDQQFHMVHESPHLYQSITKPFIQSQSFAVVWVYNILDGKAETDRVVYSDPDPLTGFVLLPDMKWDRSDLQNLYMLAIVRRRDLFSLRDLATEHLPLLKNILTKGKEAIYGEYGVHGDELRVYLHYQPSYYHLHVHFTHLKYAAPKTVIGQAHLLYDVIDNIENISPEYYQKKTISFCVKESSTLWQAFDKNTSTS